MPIQATNHTFINWLETKAPCLTIDQTTDLYNPIQVSTG